MKMYNLSLEINIQANSPLDAAKELESMIKEEGVCFQYYVQEDGCDEILSVDLAEEDEDAVLPANDYQPVIKPVVKNKSRYYLFGSLLIHIMSIDEMIEDHKDIKVFEFIEGITDPTVLLEQMDNDDRHFNVYSKEIIEEEYNKLLAYLK